MNGMVIFFTVDDDIVYPVDYVEKSIAKIEEYNRECVFILAWKAADFYLQYVIEVEVR